MDETLEAESLKADSEKAESSKLSPTDGAISEMSNLSRSPVELPPPPPRPHPILIPQDDEEECPESESLDPCTPPRRSLLRMNSGPIPISPVQHIEDYDHEEMMDDTARWELRRLLGAGFWGSSGTNITPENIYATANISAFASSLSLVCIVY